MRKVLHAAALLIVVLAGSTYAAYPASAAQRAEASEQQAIISLVERFGKKLQLVSLLAPDVRESMQKHYAEFVTPELLKQWQSDPRNAPGRLTSSPWPDRIEVRSVERTAKDAYRVTGEIIEVTSAEQSQGGIAAKRPITLEVKNFGGRWLISAAQLDQYGTIN